MEILRGLTLKFNLVSTYCVIKSAKMKKVEIIYVVNRTILKIEQSKAAINYGGRKTLYVIILQCFSNLKTHSILLCKVLQG